MTELVKKFNIDQSGGQKVSEKLLISGNNFNLGTRPAATAATATAQASAQHRPTARDELFRMVVVSPAWRARVPRWRAGPPRSRCVSSDIPAATRSQHKLMVPSEPSRRALSNGTGPDVARRKPKKVDLHHREECQEV